MKIEHLTYDQCRGTRSTPQSSNSQSQTVLLTSRRRRHPEDKALPEAGERPVTMWPTPPLRRKPNFSETMRQCLGSPKPEAQKPAENKILVTKICTLREAVLAGKLEKAIPPSRSLDTHRYPVPPPRPQVPAAKPTSSRVRHSKKPFSKPTKFGDLIDRSANIFDETRKDLVSKFMPPFEHLHYPSFTHSDRKFRRNSDVSDMSFCCIGEQETEQAQKVRGLISTHQQDLQRKSYEGSDPWVCYPARVCRLCRKPSVRGIRGLCNDCENDFIRPKTQKYEFVDFDGNVSEEIRPTPPLKDLKILTDRRRKELESKRKSVSHSNSYRRDRQQRQAQ